jgi:hypothetical protein
VIDPPDQVVRLAAKLLEQLKVVRQVARRHGPDAQPSGMHAFEPHGDLEEAAEHAKPADRAMKHVAVLVARTAQHLAGRGLKHERFDMLAETADGEVVLAVNIESGRAADRYRHRSRHDRRPPAEADEAAPEVADGHTRLDGDHAAVGIEAQDAVHAAGIEHVAGAVEADIAVAAAGAAQSERAALPRHPRHGGRHLLARGRPHHLRRSADGHPPSAQTGRVERDIPVSHVQQQLRTLRRLQQ